MPISERKQQYRERLESYIGNYKNILIVNADNVGSRQMQEIRMKLRGRAVVLMGKNTIIRKVLRDLVESKPELENLLELIVGNIGFVFTNDDLVDIRKEIEENKVPAAARSGAFAPTDVTIPAGPTGLDPGQTAFFQALAISTKIVRGSIEIINPVNIVTAGERVSPSAVSLLSKLNLKPFFFKMSVTHVYEDGSVYSVAVLDLTPEDLLAKFFGGVRTLASISFEIGEPSLATLSHSLSRAFKYAAALAIEADFSFKAAEPFIEYLADPEAYAAKHGIVAAAAAPAAGAAEAAAPVEEEEESEEEMDFDLFD